MGHPAGRVLGLLALLESGGRITAAAAAGRLGVSTRSVRRYVTLLQELEVPVVSVRGPAGGYALRPGRRVPPLLLEDDEAVALAVSLASAMRRGVTDDVAAASLRTKLHRMLPEHLARRVEALDATLAVTGRTGPPRAPRSEVALALAEAIAAGRQVRLRYRDRADRQTDRDVDPHGIVLHGGRWYLAARDHLRGESRTFRVDRIQAVIASPQPATAPEPSDPATDVLRSLAIGVWRHRVEVVFDAAIEDVVEQLPMGVGELAPDVGGTRLTVGVQDLAGMARMLAGLPWRATVVAPDALRDELRRVASELLAAADGADRFSS